MLVRDLFMSCLRRWYLFVAGLVVTGIGAYIIFGTVSPTYEAKSSLVLIPPKVAVLKGENPFLYMGGLDQALGALKVSVTAPDVLDPLLETYPGTEVKVAQDDSTTGPILVVTVSGQDPAITMGMLKAMNSTVPDTLAELQTNLRVPKASEISTLPLSADLKPSVLSKRRTQLTGAVIAAGIAATLLLVGLFDGFLVRRSRRKKMARGAVNSDNRRSQHIAVGEYNLRARGANPEAPPVQSADFSAEIVDSRTDLVKADSEKRG